MFTIHQVEASHEGIYECVPKNILGTGYIATLYLTVAGKNANSRQEILSELNAKLIRVSVVTKKNNRWIRFLW